MHLRAEDAGSYTVRAVNRLGEAISSAILHVFGKSQVLTINHFKAIVSLYFLIINRSFVLN